MSTKKKKPSVDRARPKLRLTGKSDAAKVTATKALATAMPQSADWPQSNGGANRTSARVAALCCDGDERQGRG